MLLLAPDPCAIARMLLGRMIVGGLIGAIAAAALDLAYTYATARGTSITTYDFLFVLSGALIGAGIGTWMLVRWFNQAR